MKVVTEFMSALIDVDDMTDGKIPYLLSDRGLAFIASHLGINWTLVALCLGVSQVRIEQIQMSYERVCI